MDTFMIIVAIFMAITIIPHILRMIKTKSSRDQSFIGVCGIAIGIMCWVIYGFTVQDYTIVVSNFILLAVQLSYLFTVIYYRMRDGKNTPRPDNRTIT